jgi:hypothetical protein
MKQVTGTPTTADVWANQLLIARTEARVADERLDMVAAQLPLLAIEERHHEGAGLQVGDGCYWFSDGSVLEDGKPYTASQWASVSGRKAEVKGA